MPSLEELLQKSIPELSELFIGRRRPVPKGLLEALEIDSRQGAKQLAKRIRGRYRSNRSEGNDFTFFFGLSSSSGLKDIPWLLASTKREWPH